MACNFRHANFIIYGEVKNKIGSEVLIYAARVVSYSNTI